MLKHLVRIQTYRRSTEIVLKNGMIKRVTFVLKVLFLINIDLYRFNLSREYRGMDQPIIPEEEIVTTVINQYMNDPIVSGNQ